MDKTFVTGELIRVICEACIRLKEENCFICKGSKYYFWDPSTKLCFSENGKQLFSIDDSGQEIAIIRGSQLGQDLDIKDKLNVIELWVLQSPVRKWKLSLDETGWQACVWFNRYKKICFETSDFNLEVCISKTYQQILENVG